LKFSIDGGEPDRQHDNESKTKQLIVININKLTLPFLEKPFESSNAWTMLETNTQHCTCSTMETWKRPGESSKDKPDLNTELKLNMKLEDVKHQYRWTDLQTKNNARLRNYLSSHNTCESLEHSRR